MKWQKTYFNSFALIYGHKKVIFWSLISSISIKNIVLKCVFYWGKKLWRVPFFTLRLGLGHVKFLTFLIQFTRQNPQSALYWAEIKNERKRAQRLFFPGVKEHLRFQHSCKMSRSLNSTCDHKLNNIGTTWRRFRVVTWCFAVNKLSLAGIKLHIDRPQFKCDTMVWFLGNLSMPFTGRTEISKNWAAFLFFSKYELPDHSPHRTCHTHVSTTGDSCDVYTHVDVLRVRQLHFTIF